MKRKKNKGKTLKQHTRRRLSQRFENIDEENYNQIINSIQNKTKEIEVKFLYSQSRTRSLYKVCLDKEILYVVYNSKYKELNTALSEEMFQERHPDWNE